jgi:hypothetical protein
MSDVRCWATSTDLAGSNMQRKRYFLAIEEEDGTRRDVELVIGPGAALSVEPFNVRDINYTVHDFCKHDDDYCVLEDSDTQEYEDARVNEAFYFDKRAQEQSDKQQSEHVRVEKVGGAGLYRIYSDSYDQGEHIDVTPQGLRDLFDILLRRMSLIESEAAAQSEDPTSGPRSIDWNKLLD